MAETVSGGSGGLQRKSWDEGAVDDDGRGSGLTDGCGKRWEVVVSNALEGLGERGETDGEPGTRDTGTRLLVRRGKRGNLMTGVGQVARGRWHMIVE